MNKHTLNLILPVIAFPLTVLAGPYQYNAGKEELDMLTTRVYSEFRDKSTCDPNVTNFEHRGHYAFLCRLEALGVGFEIGTKSDLNIGSLPEAYFVPEVGSDSAMAKQWYSGIRYQTVVSDSPTGPDGKSYDRLLELYVSLASAPSTRYKSLKYYTSSDGNKGYIEMFANDLALLKNNYDPSPGPVSNPPLLNADVISWDQSDPLAHRLTWRNVNEAFNGVTDYGFGRWRRYITAKIDPVADTAELAALTGSCFSGNQEDDPLSNNLCVLGNSDYKILRFYQNADYTLMRRTDADGEGNKEYACVAKGGNPGFTGSPSGSYVAIRAGNCSFAPVNEADAFTLSVPSSTSDLDLTADTVGAVWSLRKERNQ